MSAVKYDFCLLGGNRSIRPARVDQVISEQAGICTRNQLKQRCISIRINGVEAKLSRKAGEGDRIELELEAPAALEIEPEEMELDIIFENEDVIVVNKPQGLVVHPAPGNFQGTLVHGLLFYREQETERESYRPGIVHRLDKDTSGVMITAKNEDAHHLLARQFQERRARKEYLALCRGRPEPDNGRIENRLGRSERNRQQFTVVEQGGKNAATRYQLIRSWSKVSLVDLWPETGRTHQLRVHLRHLGHPILGDPIYGGGMQDGCTLMLHAFRLSITLPGENVPRTFRAPLPARFGEEFRRLRK